MASQRAAFEDRAREYWVWFAAALILLLSVDLLTTMVAAARYGLAGEANPFVRWLLSRGPAAVTVVNIAVAVLAIRWFSRLMEVTRSAPGPYDRFLECGIRAWLALLVGIGLLVCANNLAVIVAGASLF